MMKWIMAVACMALTTIALAQKPETVYGFAKEQREESWYLTQLKLWKAEVDKDNTNANAWYNYYMAARALRNLNNDGEHEETFEKFRSMTLKAAEDAYKAIPESFEANLLKWSEGGNTAELFPYLKKAYEINPGDSRTYEALATYYETSHNRAEFEKACQLMYDANTMNPSMVNWGYNMLAEVDQNAVIFTAGDNDTYSTWVAQQAKGFRRDVKVINLWLIMIDDYRDNLLKDLKLPALNLKVDYANDEAVVAARKKIVDHFIANSASHPVYVAVSAIQSLGDQWSDNLYLTGLTYKYAKEDFDNTSVIQRNYEHRYLLDHLKMTFFASIGEKMAGHLNGCYLPSMLKLYEHYRASEQTTKMKELETLMLDVARKSGQEKEVAAIIAGDSGKR